MNMEKMTLEEKLEYYQRQTQQLKKRRDDANDKIEYLNGYIKELHQEINNLKSEKRFKQVVNGVKDTRTGRTLTHPLEFTLKLNEINELYDYVFDRNEELEKENEKLKKELTWWKYKCGEDLND